MEQYFLSNNSLYNNINLINLVLDMLKYFHVFQKAL